ncbi:sodium/sugar symporter [Shewanella gaetbuli]|uniref:Sodium/sugar symporter n=1 Tax=Shewanella gaetbuli TaxID=220752 RepID=A0A9X1ZH22_9GAMM|nr:sodium/sugar symporter [Shewanella gaetbuli]MCL1142179.1 sodium/sugar symporter [Shewanella gaetbuli]
MKLETIDIGVFIAYICGLLFIALWISKEDKKGGKNTEDYFLAGKALPWWAIGASLIASNISAEQIIGMSGSGYAIGLAVASYEWMGALTLLLVGKYMLPIFLKNGIYTMPQYLEQRFNRRVKTTLALFWIVVYIFVNLTSILWLGGLAIETVTGVGWMEGMIFLAVLSVTYSLYGGLKAVAYTDILQVVLLIFGGLLLSYLALDAVSEGQGVIAGFSVLTTEVSSHFDMILAPDHEDYISLPGISVLVGGMWIVNLSYWGFNQYIIQRTLAAKNVSEAQKGIAFAAYLKLLMPLIVVLPGIAAVILYPQLSEPDQAYPSMMSLMPVGLKGLVFAALVAAIVSSLASMTNSISTIFTMDIYAMLKPGKPERHYVAIGRLSVVVSLTIAFFAAKPLLGNFEQAFQYIQEFTGFFSPGIVVIFLMGMFWSKTSSAGAISAAIGSAAFSLILKFLYPALPFLDRMGIVFLLCFAICIIASLLFKGNSKNESVDLSLISFNTSTSFNISAFGVVAILIVLYGLWW